MQDSITFDPVDFTAKLVRIPSCDPPGGELAVAQVVAQQLTALGIECELDEFQPGRTNVIGRVRGTGTKRPMVFSAHLDTVPVGDQEWDFPPFAGTVKEGQLQGRGSSDMKSAVATFIAAADRLNYADELGLDRDIVYQMLSGGAGQSRMSDLRMPLMISGAYDPPTASLKMFEKDLSIIGNDIAEKGVQTPLFDACQVLYGAAFAELPEGLDTAAIFEIYRNGRKD
ncbi:Succinyl-diaminopimelate desuccinylase [Granulosicoccus antarcticus IMCC3135]|uniref:Succinyl-diaminopimelate desuccinylase n=2 Tax=Granulosicoccus TaxID=437504 RepID=A0A2Z2NQ25_9GAMM|nr:Succinyl-diaminopimelate desuccinylase [Granulosicoccus antarcticus IMCC3135]